MRCYLRTVLNTAVLLAAILLLAAGACFAQSVTLTAQRTSTTLPDGNTVPMWGYGCTATAPAKCTAGSTATVWAPPIITVSSGATLAVTLTNNLPVPTSLTIVGQMGGGLGTPTKVPSPSHANLTPTWPIANSSASFKPPPQADRVQSFGTEVAAGATNSTLKWPNMQPGTYLLESGTHPSIQGPMGLYGVVVVIAGGSAPPFTAYPNVSYDADAVMLLSEIDPVQNAAVDKAVMTANFSETKVWSGQPGGCGDPHSLTYGTCYPPAVNYSPFYYLINGKSFDKTNPMALAIPAGAPSGNVLLRFVNAGLRMHVPSVVGLNMSLITEDGNVLPGTPRIQNEVFLAAGKTTDVVVNPASTSGSYKAAAYPIFDRQLSLSTNNQRDGGMQAYLQVNGGPLPVAVAGGMGDGGPGTPEAAKAVANPDSYFLVPGKTLIVADPSKGVIANDINVYGVKVSTGPTGTGSALILNLDGTFAYMPGSGVTSDSFTYQANGTGPTATVTLKPAPIEAAAGIQMNNITYTSNVATSLSIKPPGILSVDKDLAGYPLTVASGTVTPSGGLNLSVDQNGGFNASVSTAGTYTFTYKAQNSQGTVSASSAAVTLIFPTPSNLQVSVVDGQTKAPITDYRWIIEEDRTFYIDPTKANNLGTTIVPTFGVNFHTSYMPIVAQGCVGGLVAVSCEFGQTVLDPSIGQHVPTVCDVGNGVCRTTAFKQTPVDPSQVHLDPTKRYYISVLPGDAANPFNTGNTVGGHGMGGATIGIDPVTHLQQTSVTVVVEPSPFPPGKLSVFVFEDDFPLNGEQDAGGGVDALSPNEPGLGSFNIELFDDAGRMGDPTGQMTYDMFNMPLTNSLGGMKDPLTGLDACPITNLVTNNPAQKSITGQIVTCPKYESDGKTLSPLAGQALIANLMPGRFGVVAYPGADRIARGEEWLQTNTLDGQHAHDAFIKIGEPSYFQEFGPAGYHVSIGFANPKIINDRLPAVCSGAELGPLGPCNNTVTGKITTTRVSRTPDERLYSSGSRQSFAFTRCYVSLGDPDGEDFAFTKCNADGTFTLSGLPPGNWRITAFDQWDDQIVDGLSTPVMLANGATVNMGDIPAQQWQTNIYTRTFLDQNGDGVSQDNEPGLALVPTNVRFRDGSFSNFNNTDLDGYVSFNEVFPLFNWYVIETDSTRYKNTGSHVVYDAGGPADGTAACGQPGYPPCGTSSIGKNMANTAEQVPLPANLRVPGSVYCSNADCTGFSIVNGPGSSAASNLSTGRIDPPWVTSEGWQGFIGQNSFVEFGKKPFAAGENGGIQGHVVYASTRPFDDPQLLLQNSWEPLVSGRHYQPLPGRDRARWYSIPDFD